MRRLLLAVVLLLTPLVAAPADVSGKWTGSMDRPSDNGIQPTPIAAEFQQQGKTITGTVGVIGQPPLVVEKGILTGDEINFEVHTPEGTYIVKLAVVNASELKGETTFTDKNGRSGTAPLRLSRT